MMVLRQARRALLILVHLLIGSALTLLVARKDRATGIYHHNPYLVSWWHGRLLRILGIAVEVVGHRPTAPALLVSNHISWLDIPVLGALVHTSFLSKEEVRRWPVVGWLASAAGTLFIQRGSGQASAITRGITERLDTEGLLTLFPEGTTTDGRDVRPFFSRLFAAAIETGSQVVPVSLRYHVDGEFDELAPYIGDQSLVDNMFRLWKRPRSQVRVTFGRPLDMRNMDRRTAAETARNAIRQSLPLVAVASANPVKRLRL